MSNEGLVGFIWNQLSDGKRNNNDNTSAPGGLAPGGQAPLRALGNNNVALCRMTWRRVCSLEIKGDASIPSGYELN